MSLKLTKLIMLWAKFSYTAPKRVCINRNLKPIFFYRQRVMGSFQKLIYFYFIRNLYHKYKTTMRLKDVFEISERNDTKLKKMVYESWYLPDYGKFFGDNKLRENPIFYRNFLRKLTPDKYYKFWEDSFVDKRRKAAKDRKERLYNGFLFNREDLSDFIFEPVVGTITIYSHQLTQTVGHITDMSRFFTKKPKMLVGDTRGLENLPVFKRISGGTELFSDMRTISLKKNFTRYYSSHNTNVDYPFVDSEDNHDFVDSYIGLWLDLSVDNTNEGTVLKKRMSSYFGHDPYYLMKYKLTLPQGYVLINMRYGCGMYDGHYHMNKRLFHRENPVILDYIDMSDMKRGLYKPTITNEISVKMMRDFVFERSLTNLHEGKNRRSILVQQAALFYKSPNFYKHFRSTNLKYIRRDFFHKIMYGD